MAVRTYFLNDKKLYEVYVCGKDAKGVRIQRRRPGIESLHKAKQLEFELKRELAQIREEAVPYRWGEWFEVCMQRMKIEMKPSTIYNYQTQIRKWIHPHWEKTEINVISRADVHEMIFETCAEIVSPNNRKTILKMVKRLFQMAVDDGLLLRNPCVGIQVKAAEVEQKVLTNSEVGIFLREAKISDHRFYPMWALALMTGMRSGELFALRWSDIDLDNGTICVSRQWSSKNGYGPTKSQRSRIVPITEGLAKFLKETKLVRGSEESVLPRLIEWENGEQAKITREFCESIGVTPVKFHDLRATFITNLLARGESLARVMSIVGHSQIKTTNGYLRKAGVDVLGGTDKLGYELPNESKAQIITLLRKG